MMIYHVTIAVRCVYDFGHTYKPVAFYVYFVADLHVARAIIQGTDSMVKRAFGQLSGK